ncbi:ABC transporter ATP-binding protein [Paenibacillus sp. MMS18-CY102]|uniref:ABC transporter ATP-binding protein n=1 Tax=Paenibacillus sp. MMS18-CY102 TaxID=2682849 RepID=UPI001F44219E|nr:ABC transporter ATP-binding protein [Paenibacillus sp. MMS18-CY102]
MVRLLRLLWVNNKTYIVLIVSALVVMTVASSSSVIVTQRLIDSLTGAEGMAVAGKLMLLTLAIRAVSLLAGYVRSYSESVFALRSQNALREYLLKSLRFNTITMVERPAYRNDLFLVSMGLTNMHQMIQTIFSFAQHTMMLITYGWMLIQFHWLLPLIVIAYSIPNIRFEYAISKDRMLQMEALIEKDRGAQTVFDVLTRPDAQKELLIFMARPFLGKRWASKATDLLHCKMSYERSNTIRQLRASLPALVGFCAVQLVLIYQVAKGNATIGAYVAMTSAIAVTEGSWVGLFHAFGGFRQTAHVKDRYFEFINRYGTNSANDTTTLGTGEGDSATESEAPRELRLAHATFRYPDNEKAALRNVNCSVRLGEAVAIVGENGSGKSTLGKLLFGLHDIPDGMLYVGETDINASDRSDVFRHQSVVNQDFARFPFDVYDNVAMQELDDNQREQFIAFIDHYPQLFTEELRNNLSILLGNEFENSRQLSGGQWQRIAIARALYKPAAYLLLDEATSALDPELELMLMTGIVKARQGLATVFVTHRLGSAQLADRIIVMHEGRIIEEGSHAELIDKRGKYYAMWQVQHNWMEDTDESIQFSVSL